MSPPPPPPPAELGTTIVRPSAGAARPPGRDTNPTEGYVPGAGGDTGPFVPAGPAADDPAADLAAAFGDRYEVTGHLGAGGFGSVFRAADRRLNRAVAIKVTPTRSADPDKLLREARSLAQLRHPGVVAVFDVAVAGLHCFVVSELLAGPSLDAWLKANRPAPAEAAAVAAEVADALAYVHTRSIVHRDVKPSNVVFAEGRRPVLVDFGLAMSDLDAADERGVIAGTPAYMSPEQAGGRAHRPDGRTDVYALAATLYAMLCGRPPFRGRTTPEILRQVLEDDPQPPRQLRPDLPPELERVCLKGLAKLPADRFTTAADFADALRRAAGLLPPVPAPVPVSAPVPAPPPAVPAPVTSPPTVFPSAARVPRSEQRPVTLLHVTSEPASGDDDPLERLAAVREVGADVAAAAGGLVLPPAGPAFVACFGYPVAREDSTRQAVRAALVLCRRLGDAPVLAVVGTGPAVITEGPDAPPVVVGEVTAACAAVASQGTHTGVVVPAPTYRLVEAYFDGEPAGEVRQRGGAVVPVYRILAERAVRHRLEAADPGRLSPLVGRDREVALLRERWELAAEGVRGVILLVGDPGVGKSRLVRVLRDQAVGSSAPPANAPDSTRTDAFGTPVVEWYCSAYHQASPFYPVTDYFDRAYRLGREPDPVARLDRLLERLRADGVHDPDDQALFAALLGVPTAGRLPAPGLNPERQKERTKDAVLAWLAGRCERGPVLFVVEDLHWIDPSTESLLAQFVESGDDARVLGLFTFRPEYDPPWKGGAAQTQVGLNRLTRAQVEEMVRGSPGGAAVPRATIDQIAERTDGVPLFVEEFTRLVVEGGGAGAAIPATLQELLLARLDRMASRHDVAQVGAVIGRTFAYPLIREAAGLDEPVLRAELDKLVSAGLLFAKGTPPRATYTFKHALIQDAAYASLVKKRRQQFHRTVAAALVVVTPDLADTRPEVLAHHYTEGGEPRRAVGYWLAAGVRSQAAFANAEAVEHFRKGLGLLAGLPESADRDKQELDFQVRLAAAVTTAGGWGVPEAEGIHTRAADLCRRIGPGAPLFHVTWGRWAWHLLRAELDRADELAADLWEQAAGLDPGYVTEACFAHCCTAAFRGEFDRAVSYGRRGLELYDRERACWHARFTTQNAGCTVRAFLGWSLWIAGFPDEAVRVGEAAAALGRDLKDRFSEASAVYHLGCVHQHRRAGADARRCGEAAAAIGAEQGYGVWVALGTLCAGSGLVLEGEPDRGADLIRQGMEAFRRTGAELSLSHYHGVLAGAYRAGGRAGDALAEVDAGLAHAARTGERFQEADLLRLRGELVLDRTGDRAAAAAYFRQALDLARRQGARAWELRAAASLTRLDPGAVRGALADVYARFAEGLDTPDLVEARALLAAP